MTVVEGAQRRLDYEEQVLPKPEGLPSGDTPQPETRDPAAILDAIQKNSSIIAIVNGQLDEAHQQESGDDFALDEQMTGVHPNPSGEIKDISDEQIQQVFECLGLDYQETVANLDVALARKSDKPEDVAKGNESAGEAAKMLTWLDTEYMKVYQTPNAPEGVVLAHLVFVNYLYPVKFLKTLIKIYDCVPQEQKAAIYNVLLFLYDVVDDIKSYADEKKLSSASAFRRLHQAALKGNNDILLKFGQARREAFKALRSFAESDDKKIAEMAFQALMEFNEMENGLTFPAEFAEKLNDPKTKCVVVSMDFNSTLNIGETHPVMELSQSVQSTMATFAEEFKARHPGKELYIALNTGRPPNYIWGVAEAGMMPLAEVRKVAVAESGGFILDKELKTGAGKVAIENPEDWKDELDRIKAYLVHHIENAEEFHDEPKASMLSIHITRQGTPFLRDRETGEPVTPQWINKMLTSYFEETDRSLKKEMRDVTREIETTIPELADLTTSIHHETFDSRTRDENEGEAEEGRSSHKKIFARVNAMITSLTANQKRKMKELERRMKVLETMNKNAMLESKYNPTAGYVDIGHRQVNKFRSLMKHVCTEEKVKPREVLYIHIGDSTTDIIPEDQTGKGEPNEGAGEAYLIAVRNCNNAMKSAVERRRAKNRGLLTVNHSILGVEAMFRGLTNLVTGR